MTNEIPVDVKARLIEAAQSVIAEQGFEPLSQRDLELWMTRNAQVIGERARELQERLFVKILQREREVVSIIGEQVYRQIRAEAAQ